MVHVKIPLCIIWFCNSKSLKLLIIFYSQFLYISRNIWLSTCAYYTRKGDKKMTERKREIYGR